MSRTEGFFKKIVQCRVHTLADQMLIERQFLLKVQLIIEEVPVENLHEIERVDILVGVEQLVEEETHLDFIIDLIQQTALVVVIADNVLYQGHHFDNQVCLRVETCIDFDLP
jgi:hypothetical protein